MRVNKSVQNYSGATSSQWFSVGFFLIALNSLQIIAKLAVYGALFFYHSPVSQFGAPHVALLIFLGFEFGYGALPRRFEVLAFYVIHGLWIMVFFLLTFLLPTLLNIIPIILVFFNGYLIYAESRPKNW